MPSELQWIRGAGTRPRYVGFGRWSGLYRGIADLSPGRSVLERAALQARGRFGRSLPVDDERICAGWSRLRAALPDTNAAFLLYTGFYKDTILSGVVHGGPPRFVKVFSSLDGHELERRRLEALRPVVPDGVALPDLDAPGAGIAAYSLLPRTSPRPSHRELEELALTIGRTALASTAPVDENVRARWGAFVSETNALVRQTGIVDGASVDESAVPPPPPAVAHGDFTPWNAFRTVDARLALVDYERVGTRAPFTDAWHLATQAAALRGRVELPGQLFARVGGVAEAGAATVRAWYRAYLLEDLNQDATDWVVHGRRHPQLRRLIQAKHALLGRAAAEAFAT